MWLGFEMAVLMQFVVGLIFSAGLILAGMTDPAKVQNFLDLAGQWDPSLMFVMMGAIAVTFIGYKLVLKRKAPIFGGKFHLPTRKDADSRLLIGSGLFGIGWGLAGLCPGPAMPTSKHCVPGEICASLNIHMLTDLNDARFDMSNAQMAPCALR